MEAVIQLDRESFSGDVQTSGDRPLLRLYSKIVCAAVLFLIFFGALVKSHEAGLAVPDWPNSFGQNMFLFPPSQWVGGIFYEHVHRLIASGVGALTLLLTVWLFLVEKRRSVKLLGVLALVTVILQGVLGGLTVLYFLPAFLSVSHGLLAQVFLLLVMIIAYSQSHEWRARQTEYLFGGDRVIFGLSVMTAGMILIQLLLGAVMRHTEAGLAIMDFPRMAGNLLPVFNADMLETVNSMRRGAALGPVTLDQIVYHFLHRVGAILVSIFCVVLMYRLWAKRSALHQRLTTLIPSIAVLLVAQFALGVITVLSRKDPMLTSLHVALGAGFLAVVGLLAIRSYSGGAAEFNHRNDHVKKARDAA